MSADRSIIEARAFLFDLMSASFAYPTQELFNSLLDGRYVEEAGERINALPEADTLRPLLGRFDMCRDELANTRYVDFESDYIALFDYAKDHQPLHLNQHLFTDDRDHPAEVYKRLNALYQEFGITPDKATEQPDHITVQLEFMAFLHRLLAEGDADYSVDELKQSIKTLCDEMKWLAMFVEQLEKQTQHVFYLPLAQLTSTLVKVVSKE